MSQTSSPSTTSTPCPACGEPGTGRFCSACGAPRDGAACAGCGGALTPGAKFCHRCGTPAGSAARGATGAAAASAPAAGAPATPAAPKAAAMASALPWGVAFVALLALAAMAAGRNFGAAKGGGLDAPLNALPQASLGEGAGGVGGGGAPAMGPAAGPAAGPGGVRAPDISSMSPRERADRLFDRVMRLSAEGKADSVQLFAGMALMQYETMGTLDADLRYDMGRVAEVAGRPEIARAQADSILQQAPTHLLGLVLAAKAASMRGDAAALAGYNRRLVAAAPAERAKGLEEYQRHAQDVERALAQASQP